MGGSDRKRRVGGSAGVCNCGVSAQWVNSNTQSVPLDRLSLLSGRIRNVGHSSGHRTAMSADG